MKRSLLLFFCLLLLRLSAQNAADIPDPSLRKPYTLVVQTGIALQWFDIQYKAFTLAVERPLNLYNHFGIQANFFFPSGEGYYRDITGRSWEAGVFSKTFFHGRLTGRRSNAYFGPDMRLGRRIYTDQEPFSGVNIEREATVYKFLARIGWQYHLGPAVLEIALPMGWEQEKFKESSGYYSDTSWFIVAPSLSLGIGF
ncbi:MAG: hypothetical protein OHK0019_22880 [Saprospiraceae bacterium]